MNLFIKLNLVIKVIIIIQQLWPCIKGNNMENDSRNENSTISEVLRDDLLKYYEMAPTTNTSQFVNINLTLDVFYVNIDYETFTFSIKALTSMEWLDKQLIWDPDNYNGMEGVQFFNDEIWKPEVSVYNSADINKENNNHYKRNKYRVENNGKVFWKYSSTLNSFCDLDTKYWPFDDQTCILQLNLISREGRRLNVHINQNENNKWNEMTYGWKLNSMKISKKSSIHISSDWNVNIIYTMNVGKRHKLYRSFIVIPALVSSLLSLLPFWLPLNTPEKYFLITSTNIVFCLLLIFVSSKMPIFIQQTPNIVKFYGYMFSFSLAYLMFSIALHNVSSSKKKIPSILIDLVSKLRKFKNKKEIRENDEKLGREIINQSEIEVVELSSNTKMDNLNILQWPQLTQIIDRLIFIFYAIFVFVIFLAFVILT